MSLICLYFDSLYALPEELSRGSVFNVFVELRRFTLEVEGSGHWLIESVV